MENRDIAASRAEALATGKRFYIGPNPCQRGHDPAIRRTGSKACLQCGLDYGRAKRATDADYAARERKRKREGKRIAWREGRIDKQAKNKAEQERRARKRNSAEAMAARAQREAELQAKREARRKAKADRTLDHVLRSIRWQVDGLAEHNRNKARRRRALRRGARGKVTNADLQAMRDDQGGQCAYCGHDVGHLDHKVSVANGGQHELPNLQWLCAPCNMHKRAMNDSDYRTKHGIPALTPWDSMAARALWLGMFVI